MTKLQLNFPQRVDEDRVGEILAQVSVTKREQDVMLSETDFDERRNVNRRKKLILEGKRPNTSRLPIGGKGKGRFSKTLAQRDLEDREKYLQDCGLKRQGF